MELEMSEVDCLCLALKKIFQNLTQCALSLLSSEDITTLHRQLRPFAHLFLLLGMFVLLLWLVHFDLSTNLFFRKSYFFLNETQSCCFYMHFTSFPQICPRVDFAFFKCDYWLVVFSNNLQLP